MSTTTESLSPAGAGAGADVEGSALNPRRWWALVVIAVAQLMIVLDGTIVNIALPTMQRALHISDVNKQWVITAYALAFGSMLLLGGRVADYTGRKRAFIIGLIGFAAASALGGAATTQAMLYGARALQGAFGALMAPAALSLLTVTFTEEKERARAFGVYGAIAGGGTAIGLIMGGVLTEYASWRWTLLVNVPIAAIAAFFATRELTESKAEGNTKYDIPGALTSMAGLAALVYGFNKANTDGWSSSTTLSLLAAGVLLLIAFLVIEVRTTHPLLPMRVILDRNRGGSFLSSLLMGVGMFGVFIFLTYYMQQIMGYSALKSGFAFLPFTFGVIAGAGVATRFLPRIGPRMLMVVGFGLATVGMILFTQIGVGTSYTTHVVPPELVMAFGIGLFFVPLSSTSLIGVADHDAGVASALVNTTQQIGGALGTAMLVTFATTATTNYFTSHAAHATNQAALTAHAAVHGYVTAFIWSAVILGAATLVVAVLVKARKDDLPAGGAVHMG
ncbi:MFS transporter [Catenulispora pinistramenti]|uniref:MFS transporter n=1 Tax=Catenulispora pinistramenti TaxID=2705254 RepID=UPI001E3DDA73|nr:MFS transporter [Catenulispora pinistramenti]